jgi:hypothetical protein
MESPYLDLLCPSGDLANAKLPGILAVGACVARIGRLV